MMNKLVSEMEKKGREIFQKTIQSLPLQYKFTEDRFDFYDVGVTSTTSTYCVEIKFRNRTSEFFEANGIYLHDLKYNEMINDKLYDRHKFVNYTADGWAYSIDIDKLDTSTLVKEKKWVKETTYNEESRWVRRTFYIVPTTLAKKFVYTA